jgi:3D (Asp-Asp-Asp) domain-containing protein
MSPVLRSNLWSLCLWRLSRRRVAVGGASLAFAAMIVGASSAAIAPFGATAPMPPVAPLAELAPAALAPTLELPSAPAVDVDPAEPETAEGSAEEIRWFNGRPIRPVRTISMRVTAYSPDERSCGRHADGITASGYSVWTNGMKLVAADTRVLPFGSLVSIPGYDGSNVVPVLDRGGKIKGERLDVLYPTHEIARRWGVQDLEVTVWEYADGEPDGFRQRHRRR